MTFRSLDAARAAASRFDAEFGGGAYSYRFESDRGGYLVAVHSIRSGTLLTYV